MTMSSTASLPADAGVPPAAILGNDEPQQNEIFGSFIIANSEFALSVSSIQEVVNEPETYTEVPLSPDYLLGLFNLRGLIIPVVDLRAIFNLPKSSGTAGERQVAIIEHGAHCFGLLVDRTGDVFNAREIDRNDFSRVSGDAKETVVSGVFKLDGGNRIVQILDPFELLSLERLPRVAGVSTSALSRKKQGRRRQCISFQVGHSLCAFDMTSIKEIVELKSIDNTVLADSWTVGAINLRGNTVPVIDFRVYLGTQDPVPAVDLAGQGYKLVVMKFGDDLLSFLVDAIHNIISYYDDDLLSFPAVGIQRANLFKGCLQNGDSEMVLLFDHSKVLTDDELTKVTQGHSNLFKEADDACQAESRRSSKMRTLITFSIEGRFALDIGDVNEVMSYPEDIMQPPNLPSFVDGMVNIRGELIPIINPRTLYGLEQIVAEETKIVVFSIDGKKYAMMVDFVDAILSVAAGNTMGLPNIGLGETATGVTQDVSEALFVDEGDAGRSSVMILDLAAIVSRMSTAAASS